MRDLSCTSSCLMLYVGFDLSVFPRTHYRFPLVLLPDSEMNLYERYDSWVKWWLNCGVADSSDWTKRAGVLLHCPVAPPDRECDVVCGGGPRRWIRHTGEDDRRGNKHADDLRPAGLPAVRDGRVGRQRDGWSGIETDTCHRILLGGRYDTAQLHSATGRINF